MTLMQLVSISGYILGAAFLCYGVLESVLRFIIPENSALFSTLFQINDWTGNPNMIVGPMLKMQYTLLWKRPPPELKTQRSLIRRLFLLIQISACTFVYLGAVTFATFIYAVATHVPK